MQLNLGNGQTGNSTLKNEGSKLWKKEKRHTIEMNVEPGDTFNALTNVDIMRSLGLGYLWRCFDQSSSVAVRDDQSVFSPGSELAPCPSPLAGMLFKPGTRT